MSLESMIAAACAVVVALVSWWARKHPNRSKEHPERLRMPKIVPIAGWLVVCAAVPVALAGVTSGVAPVIASAGMLLFGLVFLGMYRNFYVVPRESEIAFRTVLGKERLIRYSDIKSYTTMIANGQTTLVIKSVHGVKLGLNIRIYDLSPLLRAIDFHKATGRWPASGEVLLQKQPDVSAG